MHGCTHTHILFFVGVFFVIPHLNRQRKFQLGLDYLLSIQEINEKAWNKLDVCVLKEIQPGGISPSIA